MKEPYFSRLTALRAQMRLFGADAYLIVTEGFHPSEYAAPYFGARAYLSGFTGSAGTLVVTADGAQLWTDGRYFLQARDQLEGTGVTLQRIGEPGVPTIPQYLASALKPGQCLAYDGRTIRASFSDTLRAALPGVRFAEDRDLVDPIWPDRPAFPAAPIRALAERYTGRSRADKLSELRRAMRGADADCHLLAVPDDIAWLYNFRGSDVPSCPVAMAYTLVREDDAILYIAPEAVSAELRASFAADGVSLRPYLQVYTDLRLLPDGARLLLDRDTVNTALLQAVPQTVTLRQRPNPTTLTKAVKNAVEQENLRRAHLLDGIAVTKVLYRIKKMREEEAFRRGEYTEMTVARMLQDYREPMEGFQEQSFSPIVAAGAHGAIVHYNPRNSETPVPLEDDTFLLIDTGGHYLTGSTDLTRTVSLGTLTETQRLHYTTVLRGTLQLAAARFPQGCTGANLDVLARQPLWELALDFKHGTGHGVGYLLNVHEEPNHFSLRCGVAQAPGMVTSDEPGLYLEGQYGIRLENLLLCQADTRNEYGQFLHFDTLTLVPFDRAAIEPSLLSSRELQLLNRYHAAVFTALSPYLTAEERDWLAAETAPITQI